MTLLQCYLALLCAAFSWLFSAYYVVMMHNWAACWNTSEFLKMANLVVYCVLCFVYCVLTTNSQTWENQTLFLLNCLNNLSTSEKFGCSVIKTLLTTSNHIQIDFYWIHPYIRSFFGAKHTALNSSTVSGAFNYCIINFDFFIIVRGAGGVKTKLIMP